MSNTYQKYLKFSLQFLDIVGFSVEKKDKKMFRISFCMSLIVLLLVLVIIQMVTQYMYLIGDPVFIIIYFSMMGSIIFQFDQICNLIATTRRFWDWRNFSYSARKKCIGKLKLITYLSYFYAGQFASGIVILMMGSPLVNKGNIVLNYFYPESWPYLLNYVFGISCITIIFTSVMAYDVCIMTYLLLLNLQFVLLNTYAAELDFEKLKSPRDVEKCLKTEVAMFVEHHAFLVRCTKNLLTVLSVSFPVMFFAYTFAFCIEIYKSSLGELTSVELLTSFFYMSGMITRVYVYCIPAQMLMNEAEQINNNIYKSTWYLPNIVPIRKAFVFIMTYAKDGLELKTRYIINFVIDLNSSLILFKTAYSCYAFINAATNKELKNN